MGNDVWKSGDGGRSWQFVDTADWMTRTGQKCAQLELNGTIYCVGGAHQNGTTFLQHDVWSSQDGHKWNQITLHGAVLLRLRLVVRTTCCCCLETESYGHSAEARRRVNREDRTTQYGPSHHDRF